MTRPKLKLGDIFYYRPPYVPTYRTGKIVGETKVSWLVRHDGQYEWESSLKFPKTGKNYIIGTKEDADLGIWVSKNRWKISRAVDVCLDGKILLQIARLVDNKVSLEELPESYRRKEDQ